MPLRRKTLTYKNCLSFEKTAFKCLGFSKSLPIWLCLYLQFWFKQMYTLKTAFLIIEHRPFMNCVTLDNLFDYWRHHRHIHLKEKKPVLLNLKLSFIRKNNPSVPPISALIYISGGWWLTKLAVEDKLGYEVQYDSLQIWTQIN